MVFQRCKEKNYLPYDLSIKFYKMRLLELDKTNYETIKKSFDEIANKLFNNYVIQVNNSIYRLIDIEFYYYSEISHKDIYAHKHYLQQNNGHWYFHSSGVDITFGDGINYGGILIRAIAKISEKGKKENHNIEKEIHGPINVKTEMCSAFNAVFDDKPNTLQLKNVNFDRETSFMTVPNYIIRTRRIGLNPDKQKDNPFCFANYRYVIFPHLKLKNKTQISLDMKQQFEKMTDTEINKVLGSVFLR